MSVSPAGPEWGPCEWGPPPASAPLQSSPLVDVLICADLGRVVFDHFNLRDLSVCDATCTAMAAITAARWRELIGKRLPKTIAWAQQVAAGMGHRNFFLWRARNREQHILEARRLAIRGDAAGLRRMLEAGKCVNGAPENFHCTKPTALHAAVFRPTAVHAAVFRGSIEVVQMLLEQADGVDLSAGKDYAFRFPTPLHYAASCTCPSCRTYEPTPKYLTNHCTTPHAAADMCRLLVENGARHKTSPDGSVLSPACRPVVRARGEAKTYLESLS